MIILLPTMYQNWVEAHTGNHLQLSHHTFSHGGTHSITVKEEQHSYI